MTRTVSKILATIAMVIVLPLMVVGTAFVAFFSTDKTVNVSAIVYGDPAVGVKAPEVEFNGKLDPNHKITTGQNRTVEVLAQKDPTGYVFEGWFAGSEAEYRAAVQSGEEIEWFADATSPKLTIKMDEAAEEYVAVYEAVRYEIAGWSYSQDPDKAAGAVTTDPQGAKKSYVYGEELPGEDKLGVTTTVTQYLFKGWQVQGGTGERYTRATFSKAEGNGPFTLVDPWDKVGQSTIKFFDVDGQLLESKSVAAGTKYDLDDIDDNARAKAKPAVDGYEYFWSTTQNGAEKVSQTTELEANQTYSYYLSKTAIVYSVSVTGNGATYKEGNANEVTFTVENKTNFEKLFVASNWDLDRIYFEFGGLSWNGYKDAATVAENFVKANKDHTATVALTLDVVKNYSKFSLTNASENPVKYLAGQKGSEEASETVWESVQANTNERAVSRNLENKSTEDYTMAELLGLANIEDGTWYGKVGGEKRYLELKELSIDIGGILVFDRKEDFDFTSITDLTFAEFINVVLGAEEENKTNFELSGLKAAIEGSEPVVELMQITSITVKYNITSRTI